jgi:hypothetical protein
MQQQTAKKAIFFLMALIKTREITFTNFEPTEAFNLDWYEGIYE